MKRRTIFFTLIAVAIVFFILGMWLRMLTYIGVAFLFTSPVAYLAVPVYICETCGHQWKEEEER